MILSKKCLGYVTLQLYFCYAWRVRLFKLGTCAILLCVNGFFCSNFLLWYSNPNSLSQDFSLVSSVRFHVVKNKSSEGGFVQQGDHAEWAPEGRLRWNGHQLWPHHFQHLTPGLHPLHLWLRRGEHVRGEYLVVTSSSSASHPRPSPSPPLAPQGRARQRWVSSCDLIEFSIEPQAFTLSTSCSAGESTSEVSVYCLAVTSSSWASHSGSLCKSFLYIYIFSGLECVGHSFAYVAQFVFLSSREM